VIWLHWFSSDAIGIITVAPLAIGLASLVRNLPPRRVQKAFWRLLWCAS
jgi:integral membrane sensor domain MASE1